MFDESESGNTTPSIQHFNLRGPTPSGTPILRPPMLATPIITPRTPGGFRAYPLTPLPMMSPSVPFYPSQSPIAHGIGLVTPPRQQFPFQRVPFTPILPGSRPAIGATSGAFASDRAVPGTPQESSSRAIRPSSSPWTPGCSRQVPSGAHSFEIGGPSQPDENQNFIFPTSSQSVPKCQDDQMVPQVSSTSSSMSESSGSAESTGPTPAKRRKKRVLIEPDEQLEDVTIDKVFSDLK